MLVGAREVWLVYGKGMVILNISKIVIEEKFIVLQVQMGNKNILLVNVYIKSDLWEARTHNAYLDYLSQLEHVITSFNFDSIYF